MNKLSNLLDDITVVSFPMMWKLAKRYNKMCVGVLFGVISLTALLYIFQSNVFSSSISFKNAAVESSGDGSALFAVENLDVKRAEILRLGNSVDFYRLIATNLLDRFTLEEVVKGIQEKGKGIVQRIELQCSKDIECQREVIANMLPKMIDITYGDRNGNHYILTVRTVRPVFNRQLLDVVISSVQSSRLKSKKQQLVEQQNITRRMIKSNRDKLTSTRYLELKEEINIFDNQLREFDEKMKVFHQNYLGQQEKLSAAKAKLNNRKTSLGKEVNLDDLELSKKREGLKLKISQLTNDINSIELLSENKSGEGLKILNELKAELKANRKLLKKMPQSKRQLDNLDRFIATNDKKYDASVFDYNVFKEQVIATKNKYDQMQVQKKDIINKKLLLERELERIEPAAKLLKQLEGRLIELQLMESSAVSDLVFDRFATTVKQMRKTPILLLFIYCLAGIFFSIFAAIVVRYLSDNKIYDEDDLRMSLSNLKILGSIPEFD